MLANVRRIRSVVGASAVCLLTVCGGVAQAAAVAVTPDCDASGSFKCELQGVLHFLYAAAGILAIVLIVVVAAAVHIYRKNKNSAEDGE